MPKLNQPTSADLVVDSKVANSSDWLDLERILKPEKRNGLLAVARSFKYAFNGIKETFLTERNFKIQISCAVMATSLATLLHISLFAWMMLVQTIALVLVAEMINTALEHLVDLASGTLYHPLARAAKDTAAGAVLIASVFAVMSGLLIFGPYLLRLLNI